MVSGSSDQTARVWDLRDGNVMVQFEGHRAAVNCIALASNETKAVTGDEEGRAIVWSTHNGHVLHELEGHNCAILCLVAMPVEEKAFLVGETIEAQMSSGSWKIGKVRAVSGPGRYLIRIFHSQDPDAT